MSDKITITKVDDSVPKPVETKDPDPAKPSLFKPLGRIIGAARKHKSMKTFPKGVLKKTLKLKPVSDPAKPPPLKKFMRRHTIRLFTDKGENQRRKTIKRKVRKMTDKQVDDLVKKHGLLKNESTPPRIKREMLSGAMLAGFISSD